MDITLQDNGDIVQGDTQVGYLGWSDNVLVDITVEEEYRNQGIATAAVNQLIERLHSQHETIETTTVVSPAMERVLQKCGFTQEVATTRVFEPEDVDADISVEDIPTTEEIIWRYLY